jgi:hypothetical protein
LQRLLAEALLTLRLVESKLNASCTGIIRGCDDAPVITVKGDDANKPVNLIVPYYENPRMLARQVARWKNYPRDLRESLSITIIDDGSPTVPAQTPLEEVGVEGLSLRLFRIEVDVCWNWLAARNIGFHHAPEGYCAVTDIDHVVPLQTLMTLITGRFDPQVIYRFSRLESDGTKIKPHPNSWFMTRAMFWNVGGYDEAFSGHYGTDAEYRRRCVSKAPIRILHDFLVRYEYFMDSSTTRYLRNQPEDEAVGHIIAQRGRDWKPRTLSFPYREIPLCRS